MLVVLTRASSLDAGHCAGRQGGSTTIPRIELSEYHQAQHSRASQHLEMSALDEIAWSWKRYPSAVFWFLTGCWMLTMVNYCGWHGVTAEAHALFDSWDFPTNPTLCWRSCSFMRFRETMFCTAIAMEKSTRWISLTQPGAGLGTVIIESWQPSFGPMRQCICS